VTQEVNFLTSVQVILMLLVQGPHLRFTAEEYPKAELLHQMLYVLLNFDNLFAKLLFKEVIPSHIPPSNASMKSLFLSPLF
jgi:hypothetical protein